MKNYDVCNMCPHFVNKNITRDADLTFMHYNYLLDTSILKTMISQEILKSTRKYIIIFDEAHNIDKNAEDHLTFSIKMEQLKEC